MMEFSPIQSKRIAEASMFISRRRGSVERLEGELSDVKENLKVARQELESAYRALDEITNDAASGKEPLPNLFEIGSRNRESKSDAQPLAAHYREGSETVIRTRPKGRGVMKDIEEESV